MGQQMSVFGGILICEQFKKFKKFKKVQIVFNNGINVVRSDYDYRLKR
jgi:hypothetical protein